jgi:G3E family GTPase
LTGHGSIGPTGDRISFTLLTGFLGSGKTTLLSQLLKQSDMEGTAVVINEFGEVGLDHLLVESAEEDILLLESGCLCCSVRSDLIEALERLLHRMEQGEIPRIQRVVIETTGLADPAPILQTLIRDPELGGRFALDGVITTLDALNGLETLERYAESCKQVAVADRILLTKLDLLEALPDGEARRAALETRLDQLNPGSPRIPVEQGCIDKDMLFDISLFGKDGDGPDLDAWLRDEIYDEAPVDPARFAAHDHPESEVVSFCVSYDAPMPSVVFEAWLTTLLQLKGPDLLRVKGILNIAELDRPVVIHSVQHAVHDPVTLDAWPGSDRRSRIVFITRGISEEQIDASLNSTIKSLAEERA